MIESGRFRRYVKEGKKSLKYTNIFLPDPEPMVLSKKSYRDPKGCIENLRQ